MSFGRTMKHPNGSVAQRPIDTVSPGFGTHGIDSFEPRFGRQRVARLTGRRTHPMESVGLVLRNNAGSFWRRAVRKRGRVTDRSWDSI